MAAEVTCADWPPGLRLATEFLSEDEEAMLIALMERSGLEYPDYAREAGRARHTYGWRYDFQHDCFREGDAMPPAFTEIRDRAAAFGGVSTGELVECLLNRYDAGAGMPSHLDKDVWDCVIGISLGSHSTLHMTDDSSDCVHDVPVELARRSIYVFSGDARYLYKHGLDPAPGTRWSITFRSFSETGRRRLTAERS